MLIKRRPFSRRAFIGHSKIFFSVPFMLRRFVSGSS